VVARNAVLEIACRRCDRRGGYLMAKLVERHGAGALLANVQPTARRVPTHPFPDLPRLFIPDQLHDCPRAWSD
jgi:hypothetical protein